MFLKESASVSQTHTLGEQMAEYLFAGSIVLLNGEMGSGKTELAKGVARGLGISDIVNSPTYTLVNVYDQGRIPLYHFDLYRLKSYSELQMAGADAYLFGSGASLIEWPDVVTPYLNGEFIKVAIRKADGANVRILEFDAQGNAHRRALQRWCAH